MKRIMILILLFPLAMVICIGCKAEGSKIPDTKESISKKLGDAEEKADHPEAETDTEDIATPYSEEIKESKQKPPEQIIASADPGTVDPASADPALATKQATGSVIGTWYTGEITGDYDLDMGFFEGVSGLGMLYTFREDGTFTEFICFGSYIVTTGVYKLKDGLITLTDRVAVESADSGQSWSEQEVLPDVSGYYETGTDDSGAYLLLGQEGAVPPLTPSVNAMKLMASVITTPQNSATTALSSASSAFPVKEAPTKNSIVGVWVQLQTNISGSLAGTMARHYYTFYPDGSFMTELPDNGLYDFNFKERMDSASSSDTLPDYGTYTFQDGRGQLSGNNGDQLDIIMDSRFESLDIGNYKGFQFIPWLDGKFLDGAYTTIVPNLNGFISEEAIASEPESFLILNPDGTFEDEKGIFRWQGKNYPTLEELFPTGDERDRLVHPAKGSYEITDFTLILHYDDGITTKHRILLDPIEMTEIDYSSEVISPAEIFIRRERARSNLKLFQ